MRPAASAPKSTAEGKNADRLATPEECHGDAVEAVAHAEAGRVIEVQRDHFRARPASPARPPEIAIATTIVLPTAMPA